MPRPIALQARWVFPVVGPPLADAWVSIAGARIAAVGAAADDATRQTLGNVAIVPGFVNAHVHLEFSDLAAPLGVPGMTLPDWIRQVMQYRHAAASGRMDAISQGLTECLRGGTVAAGDVATFDWRAHAPAPLPCCRVFHEGIAPTDARVDAAIAAAEAFLVGNAPSDRLLPALSPHAPYTVHPRLLSALVDLSRRANVPVAMHLAESTEELELLATGGGPFRDLLLELGAWDPAPEARLAGPRGYLEQLARSSRALVIHGNYLSEADQAFLAEHADSMSLVYCPRTHAFFRHRPYPLAELMARGVQMAIGTDGRGSNPDLDMLAELRYVAHAHPELGAADILTLGTLAGARALGLADSLGSIEIGKRACLAVVRLPSGETDPHAALLADEARVVATFVDGQQAFVDLQWQASCRSA